MDFRKSLANAARLLFRSMDAVRSVPERAGDLRERALALHVAAAPQGGEPPPHGTFAGTSPPSVEDDQAHFVALLGLTSDDPPAVFSNGMTLLTDRAATLAARRGLDRRQSFVTLLGDLKDAGLLDFDEYALMRDIASLASDALRDPPETITRAVALDFALAVRGAHRFLASLIAGTRAR